ncbi:hypothetical protein FO519_004940 [Halicephalobus sp. NKZ332]|nr:hypothetical protein FO519_004940 [Halicephalobus sp. NKZ332]
MKIWSCFPLLFFVGTCYGKYADSVARDKMMPMSGAAYSNNPVPCIKKVFSNAEFMNQRTVDCDIFPGDYCSGFTAVSHDDQAIIVAFRGSDGFLQLLSEVGDSAFGDKIPSPIGGSVTGHSLGGAMASIFSGFIVQTGLVRASSVYLYTLGQPRTGDTTYALYHDALNLAGSYRQWNCTLNVMLMNLMTVLTVTFLTLASTIIFTILPKKGSQGFLQLLSEAGESAFGKKTPSPIGGSVSEYFYGAFDKVWNSGMKNDFLTLKNAYPTYKIWVTGHSLGGSMASICASLIVATKLASASNVFLYTLGQPRTGDTAYAQAHDALSLAASYRVTHQQDLVPHVPPENFEDYYHHMSEVWYNDDMTPGQPYVVCDSDESSSCSDSNLFDLSINEHLHYFDKMVSQYGESGCISSFSKVFKKFNEEDFRKVPHDLPKKMH